MPFIKPERRKLIEDWGEFHHLIDYLVKATKGGTENSGDVTYVVYAILKKIYGEGNFEIRSNALKILSSAEDQYKEDVMHPYERKKKEENGDV